MITKEQLYYIVHCYPERISKEEAKKAYEVTRGNDDIATIHGTGPAARLTEDNDKYWEVAAKIVNELAFQQSADWKASQLSIIYNAGPSSKVCLGKGLFVTEKDFESLRWFLRNIDTQEEQQMIYTAFAKGLLRKYKESINEKDKT